MRISLGAVALLAAVSYGAAGPAAAREPCNPPTKNCDDGDGILSRCPPCPQVANGLRAAPGNKLEVYRESLEVYRNALESDRSANPGARLDSYRKGIETYHDGILSYRERQPDGAAAGAE